MKNPGWANNRGSPPYISKDSSYQIPLSPNAPVAMTFKAKAACGDEDDWFSILGRCSDFYVSKRVPTISQCNPNKRSVCAFERKHIQFVV